MTKKVTIAISACLLGEHVRYDGKDKKQVFISDVFGKTSADNLIVVPFCPEVAIGLKVPRARIQVVSYEDSQKEKQIRVVGVEHHTLDVTDELQSYAQQFLLQYPDIRYYIVKSKSPSCGYRSTPLYRQAGINDASDYQQDGFTSGLFVQTLQKLKPDLVIIEETQLNSEKACLKLLQKIHNTS